MGASPLRVWKTAEAGFEEKFAGLLRRGEDGAPKEVVAAVRSTVRQLSDPQRAARALVRLVRRHDWRGCGGLQDLEVPAEEMDAAGEEVSPKVRELLELSRDRIAEFHAKEKAAIGDWSCEDGQGNSLGMRFIPVSRAAIYAPGGTALYPSSVLMNAIPARAAGVGEIVMLTPPGADGRVSPLMLHAAKVAGVGRVFRIGGAQAVVAAAYGVGPVPQADVVAGPGNAYVAEAKRQMYGRVGIDSIAGPSEVAVIADGSVDPEWVAADLMAQAEHDPLARAFLITTDAELARRVGEKIAEALERAPRRDVIRAALGENGCAIVATSAIECRLLADRIAPEHLQLMGPEAERLAGEMRNAGAIFVGAGSPTVLGDYCAGTNHVLPTGGGARFASGLGVHAFIKRTSVFRASDEGSARLASTARRLALEEGLPAHARSAALRVGEQG